MLARDPVTMSAQVKTGGKLFAVPVATPMDHPFTKTDEIRIKMIVRNVTRYEVLFCDSSSFL